MWGLELAGILPPDVLSSRKSTLTVGNNRISKMSLGDGPVSMVLQKPDTLDLANDSLQ